MALHRSRRKGKGTARVHKIKRPRNKRHRLATTVASSAHGARNKAAISITGRELIDAITILDKIAAEIEVTRDQILEPLVELLRELRKEIEGMHRDLTHE
jgi:ATP-dependent protease HslVU (ClpYQ) peptidase subunit